ELPGDAGRSLVGGVIGKISPVCLPIQHRAAPSQLAMQDRSLAVKVGLRMIRGARRTGVCCRYATLQASPGEKAPNAKAQTQGNWRSPPRRCARAKRAPP